MRDWLQKLLVQIVDEEGIQLDRDHFIGAFQQGFSERAFTGSDFDDQRSLAGRGGIPARMIPALTGGVGQGIQGRLGLRSS